MQVIDLNMPYLDLLRLVNGKHRPLCDSIAKMIISESQTCMIFHTCKNAIAYM